MSASNGRCWFVFWEMTLGFFGCGAGLCMAIVALLHADSLGSLAAAALGFLLWRAGKSAEKELGLCG